MGTRANPVAQKSQGTPVDYHTRYVAAPQGEPYILSGSQITHTD